MSRPKFRAMVLDLDGVITGTARVHGFAWKSMFDDFLKKRADQEGKPFVPFDEDEDYLQYVDGKPRMKGVKSFLDSRGIDLPFGDMDDPPDRRTVCGLGNRKNADFQIVLRREGPDVFESSVTLIKQLLDRGIKIGVASSSCNCELILELAGIADLFQTRVDGNVSRELKLSGKPDADIFATAAKNLGVLDCETVVVEDAISGVQAGRNGNFGLVLGVARNLPGDELMRHGADLVVSDLGDISVADIEAWFDKGIEEDGWRLTYSGFEPGAEKLRETLLAVGNGYLGTRGCAASEKASEVHYPGTYIAGIYNKIPTKIADRDIYNNDFVNCPNWLLIEFKVGSGRYQSPLKMELLSYDETLDMKRGVLERTLVCKDGVGRLTRIECKRLASMADPHLCAQRYEITPLNYSSPITVRSTLDGSVINWGVARYRQLASQHLAQVARGSSPGGIFLHVETNASHYQVVMNARTSVVEDGALLIPIERTRIEAPDTVAEEMRFQAVENRTYRVDKIVTVYTSLDEGVDDAAKAGAEALTAAPSFERILDDHVNAWADLWAKADIVIEGDRYVQKAARVHTYHMLVTASPHNAHIDAGMPARGLHGEAYRGHIFWDELYIQPFYSLHFPEVAKALLLYRYRRLDGARQYAKENGYEGAMVPWQTADGGDEETQIVHYNPKSGDWGPDLSRRQRHVSIAVFFNAWKYVQDTGDTEFLHNYGAELMLDIAKFWASIAKFDQGTGKYHIAGVMGPDEFHEKLPRSEEAGIKDNAYTNVMVSWLLDQAIAVFDQLPAKVRERIQSKIGLKKTAVDDWNDIRDKLNVVITDGGIISQFDGYMALDELDWNAYREKYGDIHRMDRILKAEGDSPDHYKLAKQADVLMMFYVLSPAEICTILGKLGHDIYDPVEFLAANYDYYEGRTSHGSTLSKVVHAVISSYIHAGDTAWDWFLEAMRSDLMDSQGGTTIEGIHCGVMAGTLDVINRYFAGINLSGPTPTIDPHLPAHWKKLAFRFVHRGCWYDLSFAERKLTIKADKARDVSVCGRLIALNPGEPTMVPLA